MARPAGGRGGGNKTQAGRRAGGRANQHCRRFAPGRPPITRPAHAQESCPSKPPTHPPVHPHTREHDAASHGAAGHALGRAPAQVPRVEPAAAGVERLLGGGEQGREGRRERLQKCPAPRCSTRLHALPEAPCDAARLHGTHAPASAAAASSLRHPAITPRACAALAHLRGTRPAALQARLCGCGLDVPRHHAPTRPPAHSSTRGCPPWRWRPHPCSSPPSRPGPAPAAAPGARRAPGPGSRGPPPAARCRGWAGLAGAGWGGAGRAAAERGGSDANRLRRQAAASGGARSERGARGTSKRAATARARARRHRHGRQKAPRSPAHSPTLPRTFCRGRLRRQASTGLVSVSPQPLSTGRPMACGPAQGGQGTGWQAVRGRGNRDAGQACAKEPARAPSSTRPPALHTPPRHRTQPKQGRGPTSKKSSRWPARLPPPDTTQRRMPSAARTLAATRRWKAACSGASSAAVSHARTSASSGRGCGRGRRGGGGGGAAVRRLLRRQACQPWCAARLGTPPLEAPGNCAAAACMRPLYRPRAPHLRGVLQRHALHHAPRPHVRHRRRQQPARQRAPHRARLLERGLDLRGRAGKFAGRGRMARVGRGPPNRSCRDLSGLQTSRPAAARGRHHSRPACAISWPSAGRCTARFTHARLLCARAHLAVQRVQHQGHADEEVGRVGGEVVAEPSLRWWREGEWGEWGVLGQGQGRGRRAGVSAEAGQEAGSWWARAEAGRGRARRTHPGSSAGRGQGRALTCGCWSRSGRRRERRGSSCEMWERRAAGIHGGCW